MVIVQENNFQPEYSPEPLLETLESLETLETLKVLKTLKILKKTFLSDLLLSERLYHAGPKYNSKGKGKTTQRKEIPPKREQKNKRDISEKNYSS